MNAKEVMSRDPRTARVGDRLDAVARVLWEHDCGIVPVVDAAGTLVGVLTDRDLCMATYTQGRPFAEIPVTAVMARNLRTCRADDPIATVMAALQQAQVHRLPVVDARGLVVGLISTNDLVRTASQRPSALDPALVVRTLAAIGQSRHAPKTGEVAKSPAVSVPAASAVAAAMPAAAAKPAAAVAKPPAPVLPPVADKGKPKPAKAKPNAKGRKA